MTEFEYRKILNSIKNTEMTEEEKQIVIDTVEDSKSTMTVEQYDGIKKALDNAQESVIPFPVINDDELAVVGDANKTELKRFDYAVTFEKPVYEDGKLAGMNRETKTYENVFVKPRQNTQIVKWLASMLPYFYKVDEEGNQVEYTKLEMLSIFGRLDGEILDIMYELVAAILGISNEDKDYMVGSSVMETVLKFIEDNPQTANEAMTFFS